MNRTTGFLILFLLITITVRPQAPKRISPLLPDHLNLQFAGAIGLVSAGFGYETKNHRLQGDFLYGYVPERAGGIDIHSVSAKLTWAAVSSQLRKDIRVDWLTTGVLVNYVFGKQYFLFNPKRYPFTYYGFPTAAHVGVSVGGGIYFKKLGLYYELGTTDRYIMSYIESPDAISFTDIFNVGFGARYSILGHNWFRSRK
ncbi:MAG: hypothetical protein ABWZ25_20250 [Chitinophagaceae bacterium]